MEAILEATARDTFGKNEARRTRREGKVPAVLYGGDRTATPIAVAPKALLKILHSEAGQNTLISLKLDGAGDTRVLVKDFQVDPITHALLHADFYRIAMDKVLQVTIPIAVHGVLSGPAIDRIEKSPIDKLIVTNTIPVSPAGTACGKIVVLSVARLLGQAIKSIHEETSVSSLFV